MTVAYGNNQSEVIPHEGDRPHQLVLPPEADRKDIVQALVMAAYDTSPVTPDNNLGGYQTMLPDYLAKDLIRNSRHENESDICVISQAHGRDVNITVRMDREGVIGLYDTITGQPVVAERAGRIFGTAVDIYETILAEKKAELGRSQEPLTVQLQSVLGKIETEFADIEPSITLVDWVDGASVDTAPSLSDVINFLHDIRGWEKVENPKNPNAIRHTYPNGDYVVASVVDDKEYPGLTVYYTAPEHDSKPGPQTPLNLNASLCNDAKYPSYLQIETYGGHKLSYKTG